MSRTDLIPGNLRWDMIVKKSGVDTLSSRGQDTSNSTEVATLRASLEALRSSEVERVNQQVARATHRIRCWFVPGITGRHWGEIDGRKYNFGQVKDPDSRKRELEIIAVLEST